MEYFVLQDFFEPILSYSIISKINRNCFSVHNVIHRHILQSSKKLCLTRFFFAKNFQNQLKTLHICFCNNLCHKIKSRILDAFILNAYTYNYTRAENLILS